MKKWGKDEIMVEKLKDKNKKLKGGLIILKLILFVIRKIKEYMKNRMVLYESIDIEGKCFMENIKDVGFVVKEIKEKLFVLKRWLKLWILFGIFLGLFLGVFIFLILFFLVYLYVVISIVFVFIVGFVVGIIFGFFDKMCF